MYYNVQYTFTVIINKFMFSCKKKKVFNYFIMVFLILYLKKNTNNKIKDAEAPLQEKWFSNSYYTLEKKN